MTTTAAPDTISAISAHFSSFIGMFNVYDVALLVESCASGYEAGNGEFEGLATRTVGGPWDYWGDWLVLWVSTVETAPVPQAFVMWGLRNSE